LTKLFWRDSKPGETDIKTFAFAVGIDAFETLWFIFIASNASLSAGPASVERFVPFF
jgi:hypothetical protein